MLWTTSWDYVGCAALAVRGLIEELPAGWKLARAGSSPKWDFATRGREARMSRQRLSKQLGLDPFPPLVMLPHHDNGLGGPGGHFPLSR